MSIHMALVNLLVSLGYTKKEGCCHGISLRWLEACLLGEEHVFNERINTIAKDGTALIQRINAVNENNGQYLMAQDKELLDILAFYDSLELYHSPQMHFSLFNAPLMQNDIDIISNIASSDAILSRGGLVRMYSEPGIYTKEEIKAYLDGLGLVLENACAQSKEPLGIVLSSYDHTIALTYKPGKGWTFMDINQYPSKSFMIHETDLLAACIMNGFIESNSLYSAFNLSIFTTGHHLRLPNLKETLDSLKKSHPLTKEVASRDADGIGLAYIAAQNNCAHVIAELAKHGVNLNQEIGNGTTPAFIAAYNGCVSVIAELAKWGVDLNQEISSGSTLAFIAAQNGHASVIAELAKYAVDLNQAIWNGATPAIIAAQQGHASVIAALATYGADLNQAICNGTTLAYIAAQNGHASVIAELAKHQVDLNQALSNGETPAFIAAQKGYVSVIAELIKVGVNFNTPYTGSVNDLMQLAIPYGDKEIERMTYFINKQLALSPKSQIISMTPYQVAFVMRHRDIVQLLNKNGFSNESHHIMKQAKAGVDKSTLEVNRFFTPVNKDVSSNGVQNSSQLMTNF